MVQTTFLLQAPSPFSRCLPEASGSQPLLVGPSSILGSGSIPGLFLQKDLRIIKPNGTREQPSALALPRSPKLFRFCSATPSAVVIDDGVIEPLHLATPNGITAGTEAVTARSSEPDPVSSQPRQW
jgi:hypothetical protein